MKTTLSVCILSVLIPLISIAEVRTWTQASSGRQLQGEFVKMQDEKTAVIKIKGRDTPIPLAMLIAEDQAYIAEKTKPAPAPDKPATPAKVPEGETVVNLSGVALHCKTCEENLLASIRHERFGMKNPDDVTLEVDRKEGTVKITAKTGNDAKSALNVINRMGFYGKSDHDAIQIPPLTKGDLETTTMSLRNVNLACGSCVREVKKILKSVEGVEDFEVPEQPKGGGSFQVQGKFKPKDVINALREKGYGGYYQ